MGPTKVELPSTFSQFYSRLTADGTFHQHHRKGTLDQLKSSFKVLLKYNTPALRIGRPLNKCLIVMFGETGAGKSTTINKLFEDGLCPTSSTSSETRNVSEYSKKLIVDTNTNDIVIQAFISLVDVPGTLDVNRSLEASNFAKIKAYRETNASLKNRFISKGLPAEFRREFRERVYPNLILLVVSATDTRLRGPDSKLRRTLKSLAELDLVDSENLNLLVVVTSALYFPPKIYAAKTRETVRAIQDTVYDTLRIKQVEVIFVDNKAEDYQEKPEDMDFWQLPDGQFSHLNLMKAMVNLFKRNGDELAALLTGWYFDSECKDKQNEVIIERADYTPQDDSEELTGITSRLSQLGVILDEKDSNENSKAPLYYFSTLGHGYCPVMEHVKHGNLLCDTDLKEVNIQGQRYSVPKSLTITSNNNGSKFHRLTSENKDLYQRQRSKMYGLEAGISLVVKVASDWRWVNEGTGHIKESYMSLLYENRITSFQISDPLKNISPTFKNVLDNLPNVFCERTAREFNNFFSRFGSHLIVEQALGGEITYDCKIQVSTFNECTGIELKNRVQGIMQQAINGNHDVQNEITEIESLGIFDENLNARGGGYSGPALQRIQDLTPEFFENWQRSIPGCPVELGHAFKLLPFYDVLNPGQRANALKEATLEYMGNKLPEQECVRRNEFAKKVVKEVNENESSWAIFATLITGVAAICFAFFGRR